MQTLRSLIDAGAAAPYAARIDDAAVPHFTCRCGRRVPADMMLDLSPPGASGIPETLRGRDRFRCDACCERWILEGRISRSDLRAATAQPPLPGDAQ